MIKGKVLDVAVDIRKNSPTFGKYVAVLLSAENSSKRLEDDTVFAYKVDNYYSPE